MTVRYTKPAINVREKLAELDKNTGLAGEAMLRAETPQEQQALIGVGRRNLIINGDMEVAQRGTSVTSVDHGEYGACDRWKIMEGSSAILTISQDSEAPDGFDNSLKLVPTQADSVVSGGDYAVLNQTIELTNLRGAAAGTLSARPFVLSFWVRANLTGTYNVELYNNSSTNVSAQYTINKADTWEHKTVYYPACPNAFSTNVSLQFWLLAGSTYSGGSNPKRIWTSGDNTRAVDQVNILSSTSNSFYITGVQLELGSTMTPFEYLPYGESLALCQRYYYRANADGQSNNPALGIGYFGSTTTANLVVPFPVKMRSNPTSLEQSGTATDYKIFYSGTVTVCSAVPSFEQASREAGRVTFTISSGGTLGLGAHGISAATGGYLAWGAEL